MPGGAFGGMRTPQQGTRTGTDNLPILNQVAGVAAGGGGGGGHAQASHGGSSYVTAGGASVTAPAQHSYEGLNTPSVWRSARSQAAAKVEAYSSSGMDEIEIPAFLRKQAD
jgi:cell division protein FtsZ